jgi:hypothetical protein
MPWFQFHDMHSGGGLKTQWHHIFTEAADEAAACQIFAGRTGRDPRNTTCDCCGEDYSISEAVSLAQATAFERGCRSLVTPRVDGRYVQPEDPWFKENYWLEDGQEVKAPYQVDDTWARYTPYVTLAEFVKREDILIVPASEAA